MSIIGSVFLIILCSTKCNFFFFSVPFCFSLFPGTWILLAAPTDFELYKITNMMIPCTRKLQTSVTSYFENIIISVGTLTVQLSIPRDSYPLLNSVFRLNNSKCLLTFVSFSGHREMVRNAGPSCYGHSTSNDNTHGGLHSNLWTENWTLKHF